MVLPRLLLQVALGVLGFFPSPSYAAEQRLDGQPGAPHPWQARAAPHAQAPDSRSKAVSEGLSAAGSTSSTDAEAAATAGALSMEQQQHTSTSTSSDRAADTPALDLPGFYERYTSDQQREEQQQKNGSIRDSGAGQSPSVPSVSALELLHVLEEEKAEESADFFTGALQTHPALADLFLRSPYRGHSPHSTRTKKAVEFQGGKLVSSALTMCGRRDQDEDTIVVDARLSGSPYSVSALFDGHGGLFTSQFCAANIHKFLNTLKKATPEALRSVFLEMDAAILSNPEAQQSGSTGVVALIEELREPRDLLVSGREVLSSAGAHTLHQKENPEVKVGSPKRIKLGGLESPAFLVTIANVGDSRATLFHGDGGFTILSRDHKPSDPEEMQRIEKAGGFVTHPANGPPRVDGILALSRAFGDGMFKTQRSLGREWQRVVAVPDVHTFYALPGDVLMLACDGVYEPENMNWVFVSHFMLTLLHELQNDLTEAAVKLMEQAYQSFSGDNISVALTKFGEGGDKPRASRRFQVTPQGLIIPDQKTDFVPLAALDDSDIERQKGVMKTTDENPIIL